MQDDPFSQDYLLNGRIILRQPVNGYRVAIDPVFLAAAVPVREGDTVLDIGAGVGAASLCLGVRQPKCKIIGLEIQRDYVRLAAQNIELNHMRDHIEVLHGDLLRPPPRLAAGTFTHVMTNPPYLENHRGRSSPSEDKKMANQETDVDLESWARFCLLMVKPKGTITFIHRADRLDHMLAFFAGKLGNVTIFPLWPGKGKAAKRILVSGIKNTSGPLRLSQGMFLHEMDGRFTREAESVLRDGEGIEI